MPVRRLPTVIDGLLQPTSSTNATPIMLDSPAWWEWLDDPANHSFSYQTSYGLVTLRREHKRGHWYWYAYHAAHGRLHKVYVGRSTKMSADCLHEIAHKLTDTPTHGVIRIALLGPPVIERDGQILTLPAKALALLAYLGTQAGPQLRERLMALLWPMSSAEAARKNLRNMLWQLRQSLHPELIQGDERLTLTEQVTLDIRAFTQAATELTTTQPRPDIVLRAARTIARLYRGQLLDGVVLADTPDFEIWLTTTREHMFELNLRALQQIITSERAAARWPKVITAAQAAIAHDPLREPMYRAIIEAHAHLGDRAAALRQYALLKETLEHELGVAPLPETELLREAVLRGDLQHAMRPESPGAHPVSNASRRALPVPPFIGRTSELASLNSAWVTAQTRQAQVVLLLGEAGIGKSQLWRMWSAQQNAESTLIETQCLAVTAHLPFAPLIGILHSERVKQRLMALSQPKPPGWLADIARLTPDLGDLLPMLPRQTLTSSAEEQHRVFEALVRCIGPGPGHPIMLFIDDIHWADRATLDWLGYLMHRARDTPLLLVATCRSDEIAPPIDSLAAQWARAGHLHRLTLARLSHAETLALVRALAGDLAQGDTLYERSAGNPFFVIELLRAEPGALPAALTDLIQQRLVRLSDVARQVLQAAAVLQAEITFDSLTETSGRDDNETLDALDALRNSELLVEEAEHYRFSHPLIATVVERGLSGARRTILYRRASAAVERRYA
ncbi:MAG: AAA family ATPase, partial [Oscillochloris sp.]|nr:AAA family ATPase [Oscillochloris sp.]